MFVASMRHEPLEMAGAVGNRSCADREGSVRLCVLDHHDGSAGIHRCTGNQRRAGCRAYRALIRLAFTNAFIGLAVDIQHRAFEPPRLFIDHVDARIMQRFS